MIEAVTWEMPCLKMRLVNCSSFLILQWLIAAVVVCHLACGSSGEPQACAPMPSQGSRLGTRGAKGCASVPCEARGSGVKWLCGKSDREPAAGFLLQKSCHSSLSCNCRAESDGYPGRTGARADCEGSGTDSALPSMGTGTKWGGQLLPGAPL